MFDRWQVVRCPPGLYRHPDELRHTWSDAATVEAPGTASETYGPRDADDFDWWFRSSFEAGEPTTIEFGGLTFPAEIYLNGIHVSDCESMFLPVRIDAASGSHEVCVRFGSLTEWLKTRRPRGRWRSSLVGAPGLRWARTTLIGRAPVYGDVTAPVGMWRPVVAVPTRLRTDLTIATDPATGNVRLTGATGAPQGARIEVELRDPDGEVVAQQSTGIRDGVFTVNCPVGQPRAWWPHGYGPQPLYRATAHVNGEQVASRTFGFRTLAVASAPRFHIQMNGVPIFCRGVTWSPPDPVNLHVDRAVMRAHVATFADAGVNMVRVVGGLVYEQHDFWECCAELGLMVWQDAMQATFDPPAEMSALISREMASVLDAVSGNPALVVVSGGSETLQQPEMLGLTAADTTMDVIETLLPDVVAKHSDAHYVPSSPSPPVEGTDLAIRPDSGIAHWFGVGGYLRPIADVRSAGVQFAAECLAFSNPPSAEAVERHFGSAAMAGHHPVWKAGVPRDRGASWDFEDVRDFYASRVFDEDLLAVRRIDPERYLELGRLAVAEVMRECFAFWRRADSGCAGALVLAGKDMCRGAGWGLLDVDGVPKAALDVLRRTWAPVAVTVSDDGFAGVRIDVFNDTSQILSGDLSVVATGANGSRVVDALQKITISPHSSLTLQDTDLSGTFRDLAHAFKFGPAVADAVEAKVTFDDSSSVRDVLVVTPRSGQVIAGLRGIASARGDERWDLTISSDVALRYVTVDIPGWSPSDNRFHLAAGLSHTVELTRTNGPLSPSGTMRSVDALFSTPIAMA